MRGKRLVVTLCSILAVSMWSTASWAGPESDPLKPRVPEAERGEARKLKSPITVTPDVLAKGKELYEGKGITPDGEIVAYCRIGERSAHTWFVLRYLVGHDKVRNDDGSWTEWGSLVGVPIVVGSEPGLVPSR